MLPQNYMSLPIDMAGSMAKNRFRMEMLWGVCRILDIYDKTDDFLIVFDFVCDVEIHLPSANEYYQIKTKKATKPYTHTELCKTEVTKDGKIIHSILGKLLIINNKSFPSSEVKVAFVSNVDFSHKKKQHTESIEFPLSAIGEEAQNAVKQKLQEEFPGEEVNLDKIYYIKTFLDLENPQQNVMGKLVEWFPQNKHCEVKNPKALFQSIYDEVNEKASYEWETHSTEDFINKKAITKQRFDKIVELHTQNSITGVPFAQDWIKENVAGRKKRF